MCSAHACARRHVASSYASRSRKAARPSASNVSHAVDRSRRRVARGHVAEVDDRAQASVVDEQVGRVRVAVQPERRAVPVGCARPARASARGCGRRRAGRARRGARAARARAGAIGTPRTGLTGASSGAGRCSATKTSARCVGPRGPAGARGCGARRRRRTTARRSTSTGRPADGAPTRTGTGTSTGRRGASTGSHCCSWLTRGAAISRTGNRGGQVVAHPPQGVVPARAGPGQRQVGQVGVLLGQERAGEVLGDLDLGDGVDHVSGPTRCGGRRTARPSRARRTCGRARCR